MATENSCQAHGRPQWGEGQKGVQLPPPGFRVNEDLGEHFFNSYQLHLLQLPAAIKRGYFIALVAQNFLIFWRSRTNRIKNKFCGRRARKMFDFLHFHSFYIYNALLYAINLTLHV